jgi:hypothetical protein
MNSKSQKSNKDNEIDAILQSLAPAAKPRLAAMQKEVQHRYIQEGSNHKRSSKSIFSNGKFAVCLSTVFVLGFVSVLYFSFSNDQNSFKVFTHGDGVTLLTSPGRSHSMNQNEMVFPGSEICTDNQSQSSILYEDSSQVFIDSSSKVSLQSEHEIVLETGKIFVAITRRTNKQNVFTIFAGDVNIQVIGTKFEVIRNQNQVQVNVEEGKVKIQATKDNEKYLDKGYSVTYKDKIVSQPKQIHLATIASWKNTVPKNEYNFVQVMKTYYPSRSMDVLNHNANDQ